MTVLPCNMPGTMKIEHVELHVEDLDQTVDIYTEAFGMTVVNQDSEAVHIGCGMDSNVDLRLKESDPGLEHFAIRLPNAEEINRYEQRLEDHGVDVKRTDGAELGQKSGLRFQLPSDIPMELVVPADQGYQHTTEPALPERADAAPLDLHHINLISPCIKDDAAFLTDILEFEVSEVRGSQDDWKTAWLRKGNLHHDVGIVSDDSGAETGGLHHVALAMADISHMKSLIDRLATHGLKLELGIGRHYAGDNLFAYLWGPDHRFELSAEIATVDQAETEFSDPPTSIWGANVPDSFYETGSDLVQ